MIQSTSREAFTEVIKTLGNRQKAVYNVISMLGPLTNKQIAYALSLPINSITPRTGELVKLGVVCQAGYSSESGRRAITWGIVSSQGELF